MVDEETNLETDTLSLLGQILLLNWLVLSGFSPKIKNPHFDMLFPTFDTLQQVCTRINLSFAPGLLDILMTDSPLTFDSFRSLPAAVTGMGAVYVILYTNPGHRNKIYIGSATAKEKIGASIRVRQNFSREHQRIVIIEQRIQGTTQHDVYLGA